MLSGAKVPDALCCSAPSESENARNAATPGFSIRNSALSSRSRSIENSWPFCPDTLHICSKRGIKDLLPPFQSSDLLKVQYSCKGIEIKQTTKCSEINGSTICQRNKLDELINSDLEIEKRDTSCTPRIRLKPSEVVITRPSTSFERIETSPEHLEKKYSLTVEDLMASKICPVCKTFSSASNTTLNAHIDQCLSMETNSEPVGLEFTKPKIKPRKKRLVEDIYATAPYCTLEDLDRRNGTNWAAEFASTVARYEFCSSSQKPNSPPWGSGDENDDGAAYVDSNGSKLWILSKFNDPQSTVSKEESWPKKIAKGTAKMNNLTGKRGFLGQKVWEKINLLDKGKKISSFKPPKAPDSSPSHSSEPNCSSIGHQRKFHRPSGASKSFSRSESDCHCSYTTAEPPELCCHSLKRQSNSSLEENLHVIRPSSSHKLGEERPSNSKKFHEHGPSSSVHGGMYGSIRDYTFHTDRPNKKRRTHRFTIVQSVARLAGTSEVEACSTQSLTPEPVQQKDRKHSEELQLEAFKSKILEGSPCLQNAIGDSMITASVITEEPVSRSHAEQKAEMPFDEQTIHRVVHTSDYMELGGENNSSAAQSTEIQASSLASVQDVGNANPVENSSMTSLRVEPGSLRIDPRTSSFSAYKSSRATKVSESSLESPLITTKYSCQSASLAPSCANSGPCSLSCPAQILSPSIPVLRLMGKDLVVMNMEENVQPQISDGGRQVPLGFSYLLQHGQALAGDVPNGTGPLSPGGACIFQHPNGYLSPVYYTQI